MSECPPAIPLETVGCIFCGVDDSVVEETTRDYEYDVTPMLFRFRRCTRCQHLYLSPRPSPDAAAILYPPTYYTHTELALLGRIKDFIVTHRCRPLLEGLPSGGAVLDVGCGDGALLRAIRRARPDLRLSGLDLGLTPSQMTRLAAEHIQTFPVAIEATSFAPATFDLIVMNQVIEHLWDPRGVLERMRDWLRPGGRLSVATPNPDGYDRRWFRDGTWGGYYAPRHFNLFTADSLRRLLTDAGFEAATTRPLVAPLVWVRNFMYLWKARGWRGAEIFSDRNLPLLAIFAMLDTLASWCNIPTSNQQGVARVR